MMIETKDWRAWIDSAPPAPARCYVRGEVWAPNPGVKATLCARGPQAVNASLLRLDLHLQQEPGMWPQVMTWTQANYDTALPPATSGYEIIDLWLDGESIAQIQVR